jgi:hypothetical protein
LLQRVLNANNLKADCGGAVTKAPSTLRNTICEAALTPIDIPRSQCLPSLPR